MTPEFIQRFINRRPYFTPVSTEVTISFEKLTSHPKKGKIIMLFGKDDKIKNCAACQDQSWWLCYTRIHVEQPLNINTRPNEQHFLFCFLTVNQETNPSRSPGQATKNIFLVSRGQMFVASGDRVPLEHSLVWTLQNWVAITRSYMYKENNKTC